MDQEYKLPRIKNNYKGSTIKSIVIPVPGNGDNSSNNMLTPIPGLVIKTREFTKDQKVFINLCHHARVLGINNDRRKSSNNLCVVGRVIDSADKGGGSSLVIDAVINSDDYIRCTEDTEDDVQYEVCLII